MYKCGKCGLITENPIVEIERYGFNDGPGVEYIYCPNCSSDALEEAKECPLCGEIVVENDEDENIYFPYCRECIVELLKKVDNLLMQGLTPEELKIIEKHFEILEGWKYA